MADVKYTVRNMLKEDVPKALEAWTETGMHEGKHSLYTWLEVDPEAFKIAVTDENEIIGICSAAIHHEDLAFFGLYCVKERYRGAGIGFKLWSACLEHIAHRNACLYAVPEKTEQFQDKGGFPIAESKWQFLGNWSTSPVDAHKLSDTVPKGFTIERFEESLLPLMYDYDKKVVGYDRELALKLTCKEPGSRSFVAVKNGECVGFGIIKMSCQETPLIGPLYADDKDVAEILLRKLILSFPQENGLALMTPSNNDAANELVERLGFKRCPCDLPLLYRKKALDIDLKKIYAAFDCNFSVI